MDIINLQVSALKEVINWRVSLDIFLIAIGIYFLYRTLRSLGTWKIVSGVLFAGAIFIVASLLDLQGIEWIFSNFAHVALLAFIIIFQQEIRKIFERAASLRRLEKLKEGPRLSSLLEDAVFSLAGQKRGALFVFPGKESIRPWSSEGTIISAEPSYSLIMSLFDPNSPGHDGAMVVENGKITAFGVRLPVSKTGNLS